MTKTYSLPQIWHRNAAVLNESVELGIVEPVAVSADAWLRARARAYAVGLAWGNPDIQVLLHEPLISTTGRDESGQLRDDYRSYVAAGEPTC